MKDTGNASPMPAFHIIVNRYCPTASSIYVHSATPSSGGELGSPVSPAQLRDQRSFADYLRWALIIIVSAASALLIMLVVIDGV